MGSLMGASSDPSLLTITASLKQLFRNGLLAICCQILKIIILSSSSYYFSRTRKAISCKWIGIEQFNLISTKWELIDEAAIHFQEFEIISPHN